MKQHYMYTNPFNIPDLTPMYEAVRDYVKQNQGEKGFICTDNQDCDTIYTIVYSAMSFTAYEYEVKAVRVNKYNSLQILFDTPSVKFNDESVRLAEESDWCDVEYDDDVYFIPTIFNIAEMIQEYVESDKEKDNEA